MCSFSIWHLPICRVAPSSTRFSAINWPILASSGDSGLIFSSGRLNSETHSTSRWDWWIPPGPCVRGQRGLTSPIHNKKVYLIGYCHSFSHTFYSIDCSLIIKAFWNLSWKTFCFIGLLSMTLANQWYKWTFHVHKCIILLSCVHLKDYHGYAINLHTL